jgi:hypothetical protein
MIDPVDRVMKEVWEWKRRAEETTRGMSASEIIEFYRKRADEVQQELGISLPSQPAASAARSRLRG